MSEKSLVRALLIGDGCVDKRGRVLLHHAIAQKEWLMYKIGILEKQGFKVKVYEQNQKSFGTIRHFIKAETTVTTRSKNLRMV